MSQVLSRTVSIALCALLTLGCKAPVARAAQTPSPGIQRTAAAQRPRANATDAPALHAAAAPVAQIQGQPVSLEDLDTKGGREVYDAVEQLYQARVRALYQWLSDELLAREAKARTLSVEQLLETQVNALVPVASDTEVDAFLKERTGSSDIDPPRRREAAWYLTLKHRADKKRDYVQRLFDSYGVKVTLESPPPPPAEQIRGPMDPLLGEPSAPVTVVVFSDYLCPYCRSLADSLHEILQRHPKDVRVVYRQFPLHPGADQLAEASLCAADQGRFAAYHDLLFGSPVAADLNALAQKAGVELTAFTACLKAGIHRARVAEDVKEGERLAIQGTPTLFIDGLRLRGTQTFEQLSARVDEALRTQRAPVAANGTAARPPSF
jgi:protein-disulfide isomerase